jgi:hypothetical protein
MNPVTNQVVSLDSDAGRECLQTYLCQLGGGKCSGFKSLTQLTPDACPEGCKVVHYPKRKGKPEYWFCNEFKPKPTYTVEVKPMTLRPSTRAATGRASVRQRQRSSRSNCRGMRSDTVLTNADCQAKGPHCRSVHQVFTKGPQRGTEYWYCNTYRREPTVVYKLPKDTVKKLEIRNQINILERQRELQQF